MSVITQNHILNIVPGMSAPVVVHVSQGDSGVELEFVLVNGSEIFDPTGTVISVHGIRQDGTGWGPVACAREDGKIKFTLPDAATAVKGSGMAELSISNGEETVGTTNFAILVETATFPQGVTYANDVSVYEAILAYVDQMGEQTVENVEADLAAEIANRQAADAVLQQNINSEASTRAGADTTLQTNLNNAVSSLNEALTNEVTNRTNAVSGEASARSSADTTINARIDQIIAPSGEAPSAAEVTDARVGVDGKTYNSLGTAIRTQVNDLNSALSNVDFVFRNEALSNDGLLRASGSIDTGSTVSHYTNMIPLPEIIEKIYVSSAVETPEGYANVGFYITDVFGATWLISTYNAKTGDIIDVPYNANYVVFSSRKANDFCAAFVIENLNIFNDVEFLVKDKRLTQAFTINRGRVKVGSVGNTSEIATASDMLYFDIPLTGSVKYLYSSHQFDPTVTNYAFIHILDESNTILALIPGNDIESDINIYNYDTTHSLYKVNVTYIENQYINARTLRICMPIQEMVDFEVKKTSLDDDVERAIYYAQETDRKAANHEIQENLIKTGKYTLSQLNKEVRQLNFTLITDTHVYPFEGSLWSCSNGIDLFVKASKYTDFAIHCGDVTESGDMSAINPNATPTVTKEDNIANLEIAMQRLSKVKEPLFIVHGNHDVNSYHRGASQGNVDLSTIVYNTEWNALTQNMENGSVHDPVQPFLNYFYYDFNDFKTRIIVLNQYIDETKGENKAYGDETVGYQQLKWFAEEALNFLEKPVSERSDWNVILFVHGDDTTLIKPIINAYRSGSVIDRSGTYGYYMDYSQQGEMEFIGLIHGDSHADTYKNTDGFNDIGIDQSFVKGWQHVPNESIGDSNEYCVDYFSIDFVNHIIHETRMGRGESRKYSYGIADADNYQIID